MREETALYSVCHYGPYWSKRARRAELLLFSLFFLAKACFGVSTTTSNSWRLQSVRPHTTQSFQKLPPRRKSHAVGLKKDPKSSRLSLPIASTVDLHTERTFQKSCFDHWWVRTGKKSQNYLWECGRSTVLRPASFKPTEWRRESVATQGSSRGELCGCEVPCRGPGVFVLRDYNHSSEGLLVVYFGPETYTRRLPSKNYSTLRQPQIRYSRRFGVQARVVLKVCVELQKPLKRSSIIHLNKIVNSQSTEVVRKVTNISNIWRDPWSQRIWRSETWITLNSGLPFQSYVTAPFCKWRFGERNFSSGDKREELVLKLPVKASMAARSTFTDRRTSGPQGTSFPTSLRLENHGKSN